jgi:hypothetical protein
VVGQQHHKPTTFPSITLQALVQSDQGIAPDNNISVDNIAKYNVGTDRTKSYVLLSPPTVFNVEYGPLQDLNFKSAVKKHRSNVSVM